MTAASLLGVDLPKAPLVTRQRVMRVAVSVAVAAALLAAALLSPFALQAFARGYDLEWHDLSDVAQTYEAASAILSALALFGVSASLLFQAKQVNSQRVEVVRGLHYRLSEIAYTDPETFLPCWRPIPAPTLDGKRQHLYQNLVFSYFSMLFELTDFSVAQMRNIARSHFRGEAARQYWKAVKEQGWVPTFTATLTPRRRRRLVEILHEEYDLAQGTPTVTPLRFYADSDDAATPPPAEPRRPAGRPAMTVPVVAVAAGLLVGVAWGRRQR